MVNRILCLGDKVLHPPQKVQESFLQLVEGMKKVYHSLDILTCDPLICTVVHCIRPDGRIHLKTKVG